MCFNPSMYVLWYEEKGNDSLPCTVYEYSHHIYCNMRYQFVICLHVVLDSPFLYVSIVIFWSAHGKSSVDSLNICDSETIFVLNFVCFLRYISYTWPLGGKGVHDYLQWWRLNLHMIRLWGNHCSALCYAWNVYARLVSRGPFKLLAYKFY